MKCRTDRNFVSKYVFDLFAYIPSQWGETCKQRKRCGVYLISVNKPFTGQISDAIKFSINTTPCIYQLSLFVFRYNRERPEAFQEPASATSVLLVRQEMQRGAEESAGPADSVRHHKTRPAADAGSQQSQWIFCFTSHTNIHYNII